MLTMLTYSGLGPVHSSKLNLEKEKYDARCRDSHLSHTSGEIRSADHTPI